MYVLHISGERHAKGCRRRHDDAGIRLLGETGDSHIDPFVESSRPPKGIVLD
jgi:hypothetical protein